MRQILFRGKRKDNGEWVEGHNIIITERRAFIVPSGEYIDDCRTKTGRLILIMPQIEVIPETVGQYTGLTDKNGKKIFEGDIVKTQPFYDKPYSDKRKSKHFIGVVEYKIKTFGGNRVYSKQDYHAEFGLKFYEDFGKYTHYSWGELWICEIIGNIHDNPKLLGGDEK